MQHRWSTCRCFLEAAEDQQSEDAEEAESFEFHRLEEGGSSMEQPSSTQVEQVQPGWLGRRA